MSMLLAAFAVCGAGLAVLRLLGLGTGRLTVDAPLAWFIGSGWFALTCFAARFVLGIGFGWQLAAAVLALPPIAWGTLRLVRWARDARGVGRGAEDRGAEARSSARWIPRPLWLWLPMAAYVIVVLGAVLLHGVNTPTNTDDGVRVRAFTPILAFEDAWEPEARGLLLMAGALPTFVPAAAWVFTGTVDHFHVNYVVLMDLVAFLTLVIGLCSARGDPERGWGSALALLCIPLFVYHCTTTYQDAVLAMLVGTAVLFMMEWFRLRDARDLARALLVLAVAAMVKREGEIVAGSLVAALLACAAWRHLRRGDSVPLARVALLVGVPGAVLLAAKIAAVGAGQAFPLVDLLAARTQAEGAAVSTGPQALIGEQAREAFAYALFRSGNAGGIYWALLATIAMRARALARPWLGMSLVFVALVLAEVAVSSIWLIPQYTVDQSTVHRALLVATVPAALWLASALVDGVWPVPAALGCDSEAERYPPKGLNARDDARAERAGSMIV